MKCFCLYICQNGRFNQAYCTIVIEIKHASIYMLLYSSPYTSKELRQRPSFDLIVITGICNAIVQAQQTPVKTRLDDESLKQLHESHTQWLGQEKQTLDDHHRQQEESWQKHSQRLTNIVKNNEGIWISTKLFYIAGSLSLLSIMTLAIEISFYVYFHWIQ